MSRVLVLLAQGCEELEAVTVIDLLRRAGITVVTAGLDGQPVRASRDTVLVPDTELDRVLDDAFDMVVLPGGLPGADHLDADPRVHDLVNRTVAAGKRVAAICAAPRVLAHAGLLDGRKATVYPGAMDPSDRPEVRLTGEAVVVDGPIITSRGPGTAMDFALTLIAVLEGDAAREQVEAPLYRS